MKSPFSVPRHKVFEYKPLFYNPEKERIERRRKELGLTSDTSDLASSGALLRSGAMKTRHEDFMQLMESSRRRQKVRTMALLIIFGLITYLTYNGTLDTIISGLLQK